MSDEDLGQQPTGSAGAPPASRQLERIAEILNCPLEAFFVPKDELGNAAQTSELIRLWLSLRDPERRRGLLDQLRESVAGQSGG